MEDAVDPLMDGGATGNTVGLTYRDTRAFDGYTLFAPIGSTTTYLIDIDGKLVHSWASVYQPGNAVFRAIRYTADYPGLVGRDSTPMGTIE